MIECLQEELVKVRLREAENDALIRDLRSRIHELEEDKKTLRETTPDNSVAHLQEELIALRGEVNKVRYHAKGHITEAEKQWVIAKLEENWSVMTTDLNVAEAAFFTSKDYVKKNDCKDLLDVWQLVKFENLYFRKEAQDPS
ncbi:hypothetical protein NQ318_004579 [Aromia moschata]|uniref:Uncharacterized protein n=1 Tax=Aromia moschata TaxID=1265417 RepID=A0AAV8X7Y8_9CUCU|nr:hypothetical protein NQ318_004579 [Aromia moschata]